MGHTQVADGDTALATLCLRVAHRVLRCRVPRQQVDNLTQEVMLRYLGVSFRLSADGSAAWVSRVAQNVARAYHRDRIRKPLVKHRTGILILYRFEATDERRTVPWPSRRPDLRVLLRRLERCVHLSHEQQQVLWGYFADNQGVKPWQETYTQTRSRSGAGSRSFSSMRQSTGRQCSQSKGILEVAGQGS